MFPQINSRGPGSKRKQADISTQHGHHWLFLKGHWNPLGLCGTTASASCGQHGERSRDLAFTQGSRGFRLSVSIEKVMSTPTSPIISSYECQQRSHSTHISYFVWHSSGRLKISKPQEQRDFFSVALLQLLLLALSFLLSSCCSKSVRF